MIRTLFVIHFFLLFFSNPSETKAKELSDSLSYDIRVLYNYSFQSDSNNLSSKKTTLTGLLINDTVAIFQRKRKTETDSALYLKKNYDGLVTVYGGEIYPANYSIIQRKSSIKTYEPLNGLSLMLNNELYCYQEDLDSMAWEISSETKEMYGLKVQKSNLNWAGRRWTVWFALDIPIPHGPYKFSGLPGLIVHAEDHTGSFSFEMANIIRKPSHIITRPRPDIKIITTTKADFYKQRKFLMENMYEISLTLGSSPSEKSKAYLQDIKEKDNNHIERY